MLYNVRSRCPPVVNIMTRKGPYLANTTRMLSLSTAGSDMDLLKETSRRDRVQFPEPRNYSNGILLVSETEANKFKR
jgi:hypothetical protein